MVKREVYIIKVVTLLFLISFISIKTFSQKINEQKLKVIINVEKIDSFKKKLFDNETLTTYNSTFDYDKYLIKKEKVKTISFSTNNPNYVIVAYNLVFVYRGEFSLPKLVIGSHLLKKDYKEQMKKRKKMKCCFEFIGLSSFVVLNKITLETKILYDEDYYVYIKQISKGLKLKK